MGVFSEAELIARCRAGEADAWDALFDRYYPLATKFVYQLSPGFAPEDVEEICQDVFLSVIRNLNSFQGHSAFQTWLYRIAANKARDHLQREHALKRGGGEKPYSLDADDAETGMKLDPPGTTPGPDGILMNAETMRMVRTALDELGEPCREIIELRYFGDLSYEEIAYELRLNPKTVSSRLSKCLDRLEEIARPLFSTEKCSSPSV